MENTKYQDLIQKLINCALACENCVAACLSEEDVTMMVPCIKLNHDCADICLLAARLLQRDSDIALQYLLLCEEACRNCAAECGKHQHDHCQQCAEVCNTCAEACHAHHELITQK